MKGERKMNRYYIKRGRAGNEYALCYAPDGINPGDGWEKITRKQAERYAVAEAIRRKEDPSFAYYAVEYVYPYDMTDEEAEMFINRWCGWHTVGRIAVPGRRIKRKE
jgi:hypothetical protein